MCCSAINARARAARSRNTLLSAEALAIATVCPSPLPGNRMTL